MQSKRVTGKLAGVFLDFNFAAQSFEIHLASHFGMCFGVRDAVSLAEKAAEDGELTILGELVHNEVVRERIERAGAREGDLSAETAQTREVLITAHGASDQAKQSWEKRGHVVRDATCPLVRKAHGALATLVAEGCFPVVIGKAGHVEVKGLVGDFPEARVILSSRDIECLPMHARYGVVSQTTQPIELVESLVQMMRSRFPESEVTFRDTVCQPTKNRQRALRELASQVDLVIVVGGENSNNSRQLVMTARSLGCRAERVSTANDIDPKWLQGNERVGVTAGTSTLKSCVSQVVKTLENIGGKVVGK